MARAPVVLPNNKAGVFLACAVSTLGLFEGTRTYAYRDSIGIPTVCTGHTAGVKMGQHYTIDQCNKMLLADIPKYDPVNLGCLKDKNLPPHRHTALLSFSYNVGPGAFCKSSVVRKINAGDVRGACNALLRYDRAGGRVNHGLAKRRQAERVLCLQEA